MKKLTTEPPYGVKVTAKIKGTTPWWTTAPDGPAFEARPTRRTRASTWATG